MIPHNRPSLGLEEQMAASKVLESGWVAEGPEVEYFENEVCDFLGCKEGQAVAVSSGSAALYLALMALRVFGNHVAAPAYSCRSLWNAIQMSGARPVWLDTKLSQPNLDPSLISTLNAGVYIVPHMFGIPIRLPVGNQLIIEDCAQALGAVVDGKKVGTFGEIGIFSFGATKLITSGGQGGMVVSRNPEILRYLRKSRDYDGLMDQQPRFNHQMTDLQAAIGRVQLQRWGEFNARRKKIFGIYKDAGLPLLDSSDPKITSAYYRAVLDTNKAKILQDKLLKAGIRTIIPVTQAELLAPETVVPNSNNLSINTLSIPIYPTLTDSEAMYIADTCIKNLHES